MLQPRLPNPLGRSIRRFLGTGLPPTVIVQHQTFPLSFVQTGSSALFWSYTFNLAQLPAANLAAFQALFDQYAVLEVRFTIRPTIDCHLLQNALSTGYVMPRIVSVIDNDDNSVPANADVLEEYDNRKETSVSDGAHVRVFKPTVLNQVYLSGIATGYSIPEGGNPIFLDTVNSTIPHFALRGMITAFTTNPADINDLYYDVIIDYRLAFKSVR